MVDRDPSWIARTVAVIARLIEERSEITADEVREAARAAGIPEPTHRNAWGAAMRTAAGRGLIARTDRVRASRRAAAHAHLNPVWVAGGRP